MEQLGQLIAANEDWLMRRILKYARQYDYVKYTSTLEEAWRLSIANLSQALINALHTYPHPPELNPDQDYRSDPIASFGVEEARKHRARGLTLGMFLSLMKYYRQCYLDLIGESGFEAPCRKNCRYFVERCFDRIELGLCTEWASATDAAQLEALQSANRFMTNEKNKYLTIFESLHDPAILLDKDHTVTNMNHAAAQLFMGVSVPGDMYYDDQPSVDSLPWLADALADLLAGDETNVSFEKTLETPNDLRHFDVKLERMLDVSDKFSGTIVLLTDLTERKRAAVMAERERLARELHDSVTQTLYSLTLFAEWTRGLVEAQEWQPAKERLDRIGEIAQQALKEMRLLVYELRPSALEQDGLIGALQQRLGAVEQRAGVQTQLIAEPPLRLTPAVEEGMYRIAQEALNNALKHAAATQVTIEVKGNGHGTVLLVSDNGNGFDPGTINGRGGLGLTSMRERAAQLGGMLEVTSQAGQGTTVKFSL